MERIEDRSKALSYIGIEVADALKLIPTPQDIEEEVITAAPEQVEQVTVDAVPEQQFFEELE